VFDEVRYFTAGDTPVVFDLGGIPTALSVCEDIWYPQPIQQARTAGAELMLNLSASPFHRDKQREREEIIAAQAQAAAMPVVYVNLVGAQDELVFDGGSVAINAEGDLAYRAPAFTEGLFPVQLQVQGGRVVFPPQDVAASLDSLASVYQALVVGLRDYVGKNGFK